MIKLEYNVKPHGSDRVRSVEVKFTPYKNEVSKWNENLKGWKMSDGLSIKIDKRHPTTLDSKGSILVGSSKDKEFNYMKQVVKLEPDTEYLFSVYVRNNDVLSTALKINGEYKRSVVNPYTQRLYGIGTSDKEGKLEIELNFFDAIPGGRHDVWLDGFMVVKTEEGDSSKIEDRLLMKYQYVRDKKGSPNTTDLLDQMFHFSPFKYYLTIDGRRVDDYTKPLDEYGVTEKSRLETGEADWDKQVFNACTHDVPLMAMLEGSRTHVTHAFPKEDAEMSKLHDSHFPRLQFFTGFGVNTVISDTKPIADNVNFAINVYIPVTKVLESVSAMMINTQLASIMSELGWAKVRGSDYFLKNEQLYVLQGQYVQDVMLSRKRK